jgi:hypothetical protein
MLAAALFVAAPASANTLTQGLTDTAAGTVQQATTTVDSVVTEASAALPTEARAVTQPVTESVADAAAAAPVAPAAPRPSAAAEPDPTSASLSSTRDRGPARVLRVGRDRAEATGPPAARLDAAAPTPAAGHALAARPAAADAPRAAPADDRGGSAAPERERQTDTSSGSASAVSGLFFAGAALLAGLLCLTGPRLMRGLPSAPVRYRPVAFASSLERPG